MQDVDVHYSLSLDTAQLYCSLGQENVRFQFPLQWYKAL